MRKCAHRRMCSFSGKGILPSSSHQKNRANTPTKVERFQTGNQQRGRSQWFSASTERKQSMSNQPEQENQQPEPMTSQELRQSILAELEANQQVIAQLSDEQLTEIVGGTIGKVPENKPTPAQLWEQRKRESQAAIIPVHDTHPVSQGPSTVAQEPSTVSPTYSRTSSAASSTVSYSPAQSSTLQQALHRWFIGCFTCGRLP
jgi:hypothetical protein